jgi:hypothetical protein
LSSDCWNKKRKNEMLWNEIPLPNLFIVKREREREKERERERNHTAWHKQKRETQKESLHRMIKLLRCVFYKGRSNFLLILPFNKFDVKKQFSLNKKFTGSISFQPVGFVTFHTRAGAEAAKQDLQVNFFF